MDKIHYEYIDDSNSDLLLNFIYYEPLISELIKNGQRVVSAYLDLAEVQAKKNIPMTMNDWEERLNRFLTVWDH